jgi:hypothetical protein
MVTPRVARLVVPCLVLLASACHQSPHVPFVRAVDECASWAAAIRYAHDLESQQAVPRAYLEQLIKDGAAEVKTVRRTVATLTGIPGDLKQQAVTLCDGMMAELNAVGGDVRALDVARLGQQEAGLRAIAKAAGGR